MLSCVLALSQMYPTVSKPREIQILLDVTTFYLVACCYDFEGKTRNHQTIRQMVMMEVCQHNVNQTLILYLVREHFFMIPRATSRPLFLF